MEPGTLQELFILMMFLGMSAFFSASETAFTSMNRIHLRNLVDNNIKNASIVKKIIDSQQKFLSTILIGNNLVNTAASAMATSLCIKLYGNNSTSLAFATGIITLMILIFSEITPKSLASQNPEKITLFFAKAVTFIIWLFTPVTYILNFVTKGIISVLGVDSDVNRPTITEDDLRTIVNVSHEEGVLEVDERKMIDNVFAFGDADAKDVMTPRTDIIAVDYETSYEEICELFKTEGISRIPVYKETIDDIVGIIHLKDFVFNVENKEDFKIDNCMRPPFFTYEYKPTRELFTIMRIKRIHLAIILDEYGGTAGLLTINDLVGEIVGDIPDEYNQEVEQEIEAMGDNEYLVDGSTKLTDVNEILQVNLESEDFDSIGGYIIGKLGYFPKAGEIVENNDMKFIVETVDKNRVEKIRVFIKIS